VRNSLQFGSSLLLRRLSGIEFLIALIALFVSLPFVETLQSAGMIESILFTIVLISAVPAIAESARVLTAAVVLALPTLGARWAHQYRPDLVPVEFFFIGGILFVLFVIANLLRFVLRAPSVNTKVLCASISAYLLLSLAWTLGYWLVAELVPGAFAFNASSAGDTSINGFNGLYFSIITLTTLGYGDITPVAKVARMPAAMESMTGLLYVAILIARLVAIQAAPKSDDTQSP
jgi:voltage-gated potassium channel